MKELICIICPKGCRLKVDENFNVEGNSCIRGVSYAKAELTNPTRMVTSTVLIKNGVINRLPVATSNAIPKDKIMDVMSEINKQKVIAPIYVGDIIIKNVLNLGVDIVATREVLEEK